MPFKLNSLYNSSTRILILLFLAALVPLSAAYTSQYGFGLKPCELCIFQRIPFFAVLGLSLVLLIIKLPVKIFNFIFILCILAFLTNVGIAFFHMGVEFKWWQHGTCTASLNNASFEDFRNSIMNAANVRCDEPQFKFIGISMAGWNFILNIFYVIFFTYILKNKGKAHE